MTSLPKSRKGLVAALFLAALVGVAYGASLRNGLVFDDKLLMAQDDRIRSVERLPRLLVESRWGFRDRLGARGSVDQYYRPLDPLPFAVSALLFGGAAWPGHALSLLIHFLDSLLVLALLRRLLGDARAALFGAALFALHPASSEAVLWISAQGGLSAVACILGVLLLHASDRAERWRGRALMALLYLFGMWFKEQGVLAPAFLVLYDLLAAPDRGAARLWRLRGRYAALLAPLALYVGLRLYVLGAPVPAIEYVPYTRWELFLNAVALLPQYARTALWPFDLDFYHDFDAVRSAADPRFLLGALLAVAGALALARARRRHPPLAFGIGWTFIALAPYLPIRLPQGGTSLPSATSTTP